MVVPLVALSAPRSLPSVVTLRDTPLCSSCVLIFFASEKHVAISVVLSASLSPCSPSARNSFVVASTVALITCCLLPTMRMLMWSNQARGIGRGMSVVPVSFAIAAYTTVLATLFARREPARIDLSA